MKVLLIGMALVAAALVGAAIATVIEDDERRSEQSAPPNQGSSSTPGGAAVSPFTGPSTSPMYQATEDLDVGDCFDAIEDADDGDILAGRIVPCDAPHREEVVGVTDHPASAGTPFPGEKTLRDWAESRCDDFFAAYVGIAYEDSRLEATTIIPLPKGWEGGGRRVICTVAAPAQGSLTGSVKGTGR